MSIRQKTEKRRDVQELTAETRWSVGELMHMMWAFSPAQFIPALFNWAEWTPAWIQDPGGLRLRSRSEYGSSSAKLPANLR